MDKHSIQSLPLEKGSKPIRVAVLGSTGSVGTQTLDVIAEHPDRFEVVALAAGANVTRLNQQIRRFQPRLVSINDEKVSSRDIDIDHAKVLRGSTALSELATLPDVDMVVVATPGSSGLLPTLEAIRAHKLIALSNKESVVMAGEIVMGEAHRHGVTILPLDTEHNALWQCLRGEQPQAVSQLWLTASGGPFRDYPLERLNKVTSAQALRHPNWKMGKKVTIDSATLMNKGFEVIEARWLFDVAYEKIQVLVHYESIIHSMVEFVDGSFKAQIAAPDMRHAIAYALTYPERLPNSFKRMKWYELGSLNFCPPDTDRFPCLQLAYDAGSAGGTYPAVLSAADEIAVELFLEDKIGFADIPMILRSTIDAHDSISEPTLAEILDADAWARRHAVQVANNLLQKSYHPVWNETPEKQAALLPLRMKPGEAL